MFGTTEAGVVVDLVGGTARDGNGFMDRLAGIEGVRGTTLSDSLFGGNGGDR